MTDDDYALWAEYMHHIKEQMRVRDWVFDLVNEPSPDAMADIWLQDSHQYGRIRLDADWGCKSPEDQRETVVHELLHPHFAAANELIRQNLLDAYSAREGERIWRDYMTLHETAIAGVASVIAPFMPLPADVVAELGAQE